MIDIIKDLVRGSARLRRQSGGQPSPEDLAQHLRLPLKDVRKHLRIAKGLVSMDQAVADESGADGLVDGLSPREELLLCLRFEIDMGGDRVLEQIGESLLETRRRIREIEARAVRRQTQSKRPGRDE